MTSKPKRKKVNSTFGKNLALLLAERGISQTAAAEISGASVASINDWINGVQPNDLTPVLKLAEGLNVDFQWLLTGTHSKASVKGFSLNELFEISDAPEFSGIFQIEARRLKRRK